MTDTAAQQIASDTAHCFAFVDLWRYADLSTLLSAIRQASLFRLAFSLLSLALRLSVVFRAFAAPTLVSYFPSLGIFSLAGCKRARFAAHPVSMFSRLPHIRCARHPFPHSRVSAQILSQGANAPGLQRILFRCLEGANCQVKCNTFAILVQTSLPVFCCLALSLVCYLFSLRFAFIVVFS